MNPAELIKERDTLRKENAELRSEIERLENLTASGIHTCSDKCRRPMCVLRRERDKALADLARVTAERDLARDGLYEDHKHNTALCARIAELEAALRKVREVIGELMRLPKAVGYPDGPCLDASDWVEVRRSATEIDALLARDESAAPAKHPDTERMEQVACIAHDGGLANLSEHEALCIVRRLTGSHWVSDLTLADRKSRIDAARKQGGIANE